MNWPASRFRIGLTGMLMVALIYQAGACPCGCWDQSLWGVLSAEWLDVIDHQHASVPEESHGHRASWERNIRFAETLVQGADSSYSALGEPDHDCDADAKVTVGRRTREVRHRFNARAVVWPPIVLAAASDVPRRFLGGRSSLGGLPPCVRAMLQVFRL